MSSTVKRTFKSIPARTATETWQAIVNLVATEKGEARSELLGIEGIAASLITDQAMSAPIVRTGSGPRLRIYCIYDQRALDGEGENEQPLAFNATEGDWAISLPCVKADLDWVQAALKNKTSRVTARDMDTGIAVYEESQKSQTIEFDAEAFSVR